MNRYLLLFTAFLLAYLQPAMSQQPQSKKMGEIEPEYLKMTTYEGDPGASALVLFSEGEVTFSYRGIISTVHKRIKILNKAGLSFANITIPYYADQKLEQVDKITARSYRLDASGKVIESKADNANIVEEDIDEYYRQKKVFIPNVSEGSVIEYSYTITSQRYGALYDWYFQDIEPVLWSEYRVCLPGLVDALTLQQGSHPLEHKTKDCYNYGATGNEYSWTAQKLPAMRHEAYIICPEDYMSRVSVRVRSIRPPGQKPVIIIEDWQKAATDLIQSEYFGERLSLLISPELQKIAKELTANEPDPKAKIKAIYDYVRIQMAWDGRTGIYPSLQQSLKKAHDLHKGSLADINMLLTYMLRAADIEADPALCSTGPNGRPVPDYPSTGQFDQVLSYARAGNEGFLLDASEPYTPYTILAPKNLNTQVLLIDKQPQWIQISTPKVSKNSTLVDATLKPDNRLLLNIQKMHSNYEALDFRQTIMAAQKKETAINDLLENLSMPVAIDSFSFSNLSENLEEPVKTKIYAKVELPDNNNFVMVNYGLNHNFAQNPFKATERFYPIQFLYPQEYVHNFTLNIPADYTVESVPDGLKLTFSSDKAIDFSFISDRSTEGKVQIHTKLSINRVDFLAEDYENMRLFFDKVAEKLNETIVLKKK